MKGSILLYTVVLFLMFIMLFVAMLFPERTYEFDLNPLMQLNKQIYEERSEIVVMCNSTLKSPKPIGSEQVFVYGFKEENKFDAVYENIMSVLSTKEWNSSNIHEIEDYLKECEVEFYDYGVCGGVITFNITCFANTMLIPNGVVDFNISFIGDVSEG